MLFKDFDFNVDLLEGTVDLSSSDWDSVSLFLENEYPDVFSAMGNEGYEISFDDADIVNPICFEDKVVGFISLLTCEGLGPTFNFCDCFILPEFRGRGFIKRFLFAFAVNPNFTLSISRPNRCFVDLLIHIGFAKKISSSVVASFISFVDYYGNIFVNKKIKRLYRNISEHADDEIVSSIYDYDLCSVVEYDTENVVCRTDCFVMIFNPRDSDFKGLNLRKKFKKVSEGYLNKIFDRTYREDISEFFDEFVENIQNRVSIDNMLGTNDALTSEFKDYLEAHDLSEDDGFVLINRLRSELDANVIDKFSVGIRLDYLASNFSNLDNIVSSRVDMDKFPKECYCCGKDITDLINVCDECGYLLYPEGNLVEHMENMDISGEMEKLRDDLEISDDSTVIRDYLDEYIYTNNLDEDEVYTAQFNIASYEYLKYITENAPYTSIPSFDDKHFLDYGTVENFLLEMEYIKELSDYSSYRNLLIEQANAGDFRIYNVDEIGNMNDKQIKDIVGIKYEPTGSVEDFNTPTTLFYHKYIHGFLFYEFDEYYKKHSNSEVLDENVALDFIYHKLEVAGEEEKADVYLNSLLSSFEIFREYNIYDALISIIQAFIVSSNMYFDEYGVVSHDINIIRIMNKENDALNKYDLKELFDKAFDSLALEEYKNNKAFIYNELKNSVEE